MRIVLFASPGILGPFILATFIQLKEDVKYIVLPTSPHSASPGELLTLAQQANIPVLTPSRVDASDFIALLKEASPDVIIVATFDKKIPRAVIDCARYAAINIHPSLLPAYRGACPEFWVIRNGEKGTGVTIHYLSEKIDSGDIIFQEKVPIGDDDTVGILLYRLATVSSHLIMRLREAFQKDTPLPRRPQDNKRGSAAPLVQQSDLQINWHSSSRDIYNLIRAANPVGGAWTTFRGFQMKIWHVHITRESIHSHKEPLHRKPGTLMIEPAHKKVFVQTGTGPLELTVIQLALYYILDAWSFVEKSFVKNGECLT